ncbi:NAD-dependent epimerase/dehydratase family protein [Lachnospiraceae bacterium C1.1]|nr:NAD-dependent epimerase/dehydratase family protein [Lachnospiraceae bacterium C1.1]
MKEININESTILITGVAGFIGGALALRLIAATCAQIIGIDNLNDYYDVRLKEYRLNRIREQDDDHRFTFIKVDIADKDVVFDVFDAYKPDIVVHLAAQAGVRYSIDNPSVYIQSNIIGFFNMVEACRKSIEMNSPVKHFLFASSSSVYGNNEKIPYSENDSTDQPVSFYAATKKADEVIGYSYAKLYGIPMTGMRFFTVYGPAGRPDMAYYKFTEKLVKGEKIELYNYGKNRRDFTYIDDVVDIIEKLVGEECGTDSEKIYRIFNIGNNNPIETIEFIGLLERALKQKKVLIDDFNISDYVKFSEAQMGDVETTYADIDRVFAYCGIKPRVKIVDGLMCFAEWYEKYSSNA